MVRRIERMARTDRAWGARGRHAILALLTALPLVACTSGGGRPQTASTHQVGDAGDGSRPDAARDACGPLTTAWTRCAANPLVEAGYRQSDGRYQVSIGDPDVQFDTAAGLWRAWWSTTVETRYGEPNPEIGIQYAQSADGIEWTVQPALTIAASGTPSDWDSSKLETPSVLHLPGNPAGTRYVLFYAGADANQRTVTVPGGGTYAVTWYQIGAALSDDGKHFTRISAGQSPYGKAGLVLEGKDAFPGLADGGAVDGALADPEIVFDGTTLHLFFASLAVDANNAELAYGISHATSTDGLHWHADPRNPIATLIGGKGPSVVRDADGTWEMFFQRDSDQDLQAVPSTFFPQLGIWRSTSSDLETWSAPAAKRELEWDGALPSEAYGWIAAGDMTLTSGEYRYYYPAFSALAPPDPSWTVPTRSGAKPSLIVLDMARRD